MTSFASPLFWQIRYLVTNLNKKNFKSSVAELNQLIDLYGQDSRLFLIQCLVEETDFRDQRAHHQHKDYQKILLLAHEISQATAKPNFASIICQVLESQTSGSRARPSGHQRIITEDFLIQFCRALKLTLPQQITIAAGLCESLDTAVVAEAVKFLKAKLPELSNSGAGKLTPEALHTLAYVMQIREEFTAVPAETAAFLKVIKATQLTTPEDISVDMIPLMINELTAADCGEFKGPDGLTALAKDIVMANCPLSELMEDIGYQCTTNVQTMNELLEECDLQSINESEIARVLGMLARTHTGLDDELSSVLAGSFLPMTLSDNIKDDDDGAVATGWNVPVLSQVLASRFPMLDWQKVAKELDHDGFHLPDQRALNIVLTAYRGASKQPFPISVLFPKWNNTIGQLSFLNQAIAAPADTLNFSTSARTQPPFDASSISQGSTNQAWLSLDLFSTLLTLAETEHYAAVKGLFTKPARICPELLLSGLAQCSSTWDNMRNEMFDELLLNYTSPKAHKHTSALMQRLWQCNREVVVYACTLSFRRNGFAVMRGTVMDITQELDGGLQAMIACPQKDFVLSFACAAAEKQLLKLDEFLTQELSNQARGKAFVADMVKFVRNNQSQATKPGNPAAAFSLDALSVLLKFLQSAQGSVGSPVAEEIAQVADSCLKSHNELAHPNNADDIEEKANSYFQKIYTSEQSIEEVIAMLKRFKNSQELREQEIFACMIHNLFDEYRFFHKYPEKELRITGILFGTLIQHQLVSSITLGIALRYVLEALRKPPGSGSNGKMFRFGMFALEQFKARLGEWPQYCSHIVAIQHLSTNSPDLVAEIQTLMANPVAGAGASDGGAGAATSDPSADSAGAGGAQRQQLMQAQQQAEQEAKAKAEQQAQQQAQQEAAAKQQQQQAAQQATVQQQQMMAQQQQQQQQQQAQTTSGLNVNSSIFQGNAPGGGNSTGSIGGIGASQQQHQDQQQQGGGGMMQQMFGSAGGPKLLHQNPQQQTQQLQQTVRGGDKGAGAGFGASMNIDTLLGQDEEAPPVPEQGVTDRIHFIINNIAIANMDVKVAELKSFFHEEHAPWLGNYLVVKRISTQPNFHQMYMTFLEKINMPAVESAALRFSLQNVGKLLRSEKITTSTSERSLLKNLGHWLGLMTVARDRPLLQRDLDLKRLLLQAYESGRLIAVTPFAAKVLEGCKDSKIFKPPNPWTMGLLGTLHEIYDVPELKLNIKFEIEVLCKALKVKLEDLKLPYGPILTKCKQPLKDGNPDFAVKHSSGSQSNSAPGMGMGDSDGPGSHDVHSDPSHGDGDGDGGSFPEGFQEGTVIPNLAAYVSINLSVTLFNQHPHLKRVVPVAVDRAIREIIQPVVERSVTIACITSRELILKDFAMEPDETKMRKAAHLMVSNLAGSLALVTCKEPLRVSMSNHLRSLLQSATQDATLIEQVVQVCSAENLELGCMLIEKAATEKAMRDIDEGLAPALAGRRKHREQTGQPFYDMSIFTSGNRYPQALPEPLRPKPGGLQPQHLLVYEAFHRSWQPMTPPTAGAGVAGAAATPPTRGGAVPTAAGAAAAAAAATAGGAAAAPALGQHSVGGGAFAQAGGGVADLAKAAQGVGGGMDLGGKAGKDVGGAASAFSSTGGLGSGAGSSAPAAPPQPQLTTSQALEKYNGSMVQLEKVVATLPRQPGFSLSSLGGDHEIVTIMRDVRATAQMTQIAHREESTLAFSQKVFKRLYDKSNVRAGEGGSGAQVDTLLLEVMCALLDSLREACKKIKKELTQWVMYAPTVMNLNEQGSNGGKLHAEVMTALLRVKLLRLSDVDDHLKRMMDGGRNMTGVELAMVVARQSIVADGVATAAELPGSLDVLTKMVQRAQAGGNSNLSAQAASGISHLLEEVKQAASNSLIGVGAGGKEKKGSSLGKLKGSANNSPRPQDPAGLREQVTYLLEHWIRIWSETPGSEKAYASYLSLLQQQGVLKTEDNSERFFRITTELCIESCFNNSKSSEVDSRGRPQLQYGVVDAFSKLVVLLVKYADPVTVNTSAKINLLTRVLSIITRVLLSDYRQHAANSGGGKLEGARGKRFDQRAYYRLFVNLLQDLNAPDPVLDASNFQVLTAFANCFHSLQPLFVPGFGFAWLELISHRMFMPNLLIAKQHKGWPPLQRLLVDLFRFLEPYLRTAELNDGENKQLAQTHPQPHSYSYLPSSVLQPRACSTKVPSASCSCCSTTSPSSSATTTSPFATSSRPHASSSATLSCRPSRVTCVCPTLSRRT
jgi:CCR4-NOT transcription complex subunit 1